MMEKITSSAVIGVPSWNLTFSCRWNVHVFLSSDSVQLLASSGLGSSVGENSSRLWYILDCTSSAGAWLLTPGIRIAGSGVSRLVSVPPFLGVMPWARACSSVINPARLAVARRVRRVSSGMDSVSWCAGHGRLPSPGTSQATQPRSRRDAEGLPASGVPTPYLERTKVACDLRCDRRHSDGSCRRAPDGLDKFRRIAPPGVRTVRTFCGWIGPPYLGSLPRVGLHGFDDLVDERTGRGRRRAVGGGITTAGGRGIRAGLWRPGGGPSPLFGTRCFRTATRGRMGSDDEASPAVCRLHVLRHATPPHSDTVGYGSG